MNIQKDSISGARLVLWCAALAIAAVAFLTSPTVMAGPCDAADYNLEVTFDSNGCANGVVVPTDLQCDATDSDNPSECVHVKETRGRVIRWKAADSSKEFSIVFDPTMRPQYSSKNGCVRKAINTKAPPVRGKKMMPVKYKYSIATMTEEESKTVVNTTCEAHDPEVIVEH